MHHKASFTFRWPSSCALFTSHSPISTLLLCRDDFSERVDYMNKKGGTRLQNVSHTYLPCSSSVASNICALLFEWRLVIGDW